MRHAKSSWDEPTLDDHERPLSKRGAKSAPEIAKYLRREELWPDLVLCSGSVRTRATLPLLLAESNRPAPEIRYDDSLYLALPETMLALVQQTGGAAAHVMVIGHNPGMHALALELTGGGDRKAIAGLAREFPTAALAVFTFDAARWSEIKSGAGRLEHFATPRRLAS
jgi:phosphohistidine phosphatase